MLQSTDASWEPKIHISEFYRFKKNCFKICNLDLIAKQITEM